MTNQPAIDDQMTSLIHQMPPAWQGYATSLLVLLMILGRLAASNTGVLTAIKSVFTGSVHGIAPTPAQKQPATPTAPVATATPPTPPTP